MVKPYSPHPTARGLQLALLVNIFFTHLLSMTWGPVVCDIPPPQGLCVKELGLVLEQEQCSYKPCMLRLVLTSVLGTQDRLSGALGNTTAINTSLWSMTAWWRQKNPLGRSGVCH